MADVLNVTRPVARVLPSEEWSRLGDPQITALPPGAATVLVVEIAGEIVAHVVTMLVAHVEGLTVDPAYQTHAGVGRALISLLAATLRRAGVEEALTQIDTPAMEILCAKAGGRPLPGVTWVLPITDTVM